MLSETIQKKAVLKKYRETNSACSLYSLVDQNPEHFIVRQNEIGEKEETKEQAEQRASVERLLEKVSCPLHIKVE